MWGSWQFWMCWWLNIEILSMKGHFKPASIQSYHQQKKARVRGRDTATNRIQVLVATLFLPFLTLDIDIDIDRFFCDWCEHGFMLNSDRISSTDELREQLQKPWKAPNFKSSLFLILKGTCFYYICYMFIVGSRRESVYFKNYDIQSKYKNYSFLSCWTWHKTCKVRNATNLLVIYWNGI